MLVITIILGEDWKFLYSFVGSISLKKLELELHNQCCGFLSRNDVFFVMFTKNCREVISDHMVYHLASAEGKIGGVGKTVEIDEVNLYETSSAW